MAFNLGLVLFLSCNILDHKLDKWNKIMRLSGKYPFTKSLCGPRAADTSVVSGCSPIRSGRAGSVSCPASPGARSASRTLISAIYLRLASSAMANERALLNQF
ncbi:Uncharacterized protein Fot_31106 [Forsythia ovata]|uniref:Uncharacterized protein n=1 Tax=Forsythia ovata TaxID=205694 RepID=A0ABD1T425_9LAMI